MIDKLHYWLAYYLAYKFSGAHEKPTSDKKYDPKIVNSKHPLTAHLRSLEKNYYQELSAKHNSYTQLHYLHASQANPEIFNRFSKNKTKPVVIKGLLTNTSAVKNWGPTYFRENYGKTKLLTLQQPNSKTTTAYTSFNEALDFKNLTLTESINQMQNGDKPVYVNNIKHRFFMTIQNL